MKTELLKIEMDKKRLEVINKMKTMKGREIVEKTGILPAAANAIMTERVRFENYNQIIKAAEDLGL